MAQIDVESPQDLGENDWLCITLGTPQGPALTLIGASTETDTAVFLWEQMKDSGGQPVKQQQWQIEMLDDTYFKIISLQSGLVLRPAERSTHNGAPIVQAKWSGDDTERWYRVPLDGGGFMLKNKKSGKVLDVANGVTTNGATIDQWTDHKGKNQTWHWWHQ